MSSPYAKKTSASCFSQDTEVSPFAFLCELLTGEHLIALQVFLNGLVHDLLRQGPVVVRVGFQPVAGELFVKGGLAVARLIAAMV